MYFWTFGLRKTWLDQCLKSLVSEESSTSNMVNGPKHCWNLNERTFTTFCQINSVGKNLSERYAKSKDYLLTHWLEMTNIFFLIETIYCKILRCNYPRNKKIFHNFFFHFLNLSSILNFFKKTISLIADVFFNLGTPKNMVR